MKKLAAVAMVAALFALVVVPAAALQDGEKCCCKDIAGDHFKKDHKKPPPPPPDGKKKDGPPPPEGREKKGPPPGAKEGDKREKCGKDAVVCAEELRKRKDCTPEEIDAYVKLHFKLYHPDGCCHCSCGHKTPPEKSGGGDVDGGKKPVAKNDDGGKKPERKCGTDPAGYCEVLRKKGFGKDEIEQNVKEHFKHHPDGCCHCFCGHDEDSGKKNGGGKEEGGKDSRKGNNGVGNGLDPQPPGKPPVNDGAGTGPGNPGNKKGGDGKK
jgi:hypothetical protein